MQSEKRSPSRHLLLSLFSLAGAFVLAGAGCGRIAKNGPEVGGESHFLHWCSGNCEEEGLECISGLCTKPCVVAEPGACSALSGSSCTDRSIEPGAVAVCDVSCVGNSDCAALGSEYGCDGSFCRAPEITRGESSESMGAGGGSTLGGGGTGGDGSTARSCDECLAGTLLAWGWAGGFLAGGPGSYITSCNSYTHLIDPSGTVDSRGPECVAPLEGCPSSELAELNATLQNPEIQAAFQAHTVFGRDGRVVDGQAREIALDGENFFVGGPCVGDDPSCIAIPAVIDSLVSQLQALDTLGLSQGLCARVFPEGWKF